MDDKDPINAAFEHLIHADELEEVEQRESVRLILKILMNSMTLANNNALRCKSQVERRKETDLIIALSEGYYAFLHL